MTEEFPQEDYRFKRKSSSGQADHVVADSSAPESFEDVDYKSMRKEQAPPGPSPSPTYQPVSTPAWDKHATDGHAKVQRFNRLTTWDRRKRIIQTILFWVFLIFALGGISYAYQNRLQLGFPIQPPPSVQPSNLQPSN